MGLIALGGIASGLGIACGQASRHWHRNSTEVVDFRMIPVDPCASGHTSIQPKWTEGEIHRKQLGDSDSCNTRCTGFRQKRARKKKKKKKKKNPSALIPLL